MKFSKQFEECVIADCFGIDFGTTNSSAVTNLISAMPLQVSSMAWKAAFSFLSERDAIAAAVN